MLCAGVLRSYRPELIEMVLNHLQPKCVRLGILSQKFDGKTSLIEPWYGSAYNARKIDPTLISAWSAVEPIPELCLPKPNEFIPTDFTIVPKLCAQEMPKTPVLIKVTTQK